MSTKITKGQNKRIWGKLHATEEVAWRDEYVAKASNGRVFNMSELEIGEAHVMLSLLHDVEQGLMKPCNPHSKLQEQFNALPHTMLSVQREPSPVKVETPGEKANRLRRNVLRYCHDLGWYEKKPGTLDAYIEFNGKKKLDYVRIDNYCLAHSAVKKKLKDHTLEELPKLVLQFKLMVQNTVFKKEKSNS